VDLNLGDFATIITPFSSLGAELLLPDHRFGIGIAAYRPFRSH